MANIKYTGKGITTLGVSFVEGEYTLSEKATEYLLATFPLNFSLVSDKKETIAKEPIAKEPVAKEDTKEKELETKRSPKGK